MTDGSEKRKHQLTFELQRSRVFKNPTPMRSPLSQKVTWPAATRENPGNEIIEESNFSDVSVLQPQNKRSRYEMRNGYEACQISLLYVCLFDGAQRSMTFLSFCFFCLFVCLFVVVVVVVSQRCITLFNHFLNNFLSFQLIQDKLRHRWFDLLSLPDFITSFLY